MLTIKHLQASSHKQQPAVVSQQAPVLLGRRTALLGALIATTGAFSRGAREGAGRE
jgi:hypothetical protein